MQRINSKTNSIFQKYFNICITSSINAPQVISDKKQFKLQNTSMIGKDLLWLNKTVMFHTVFVQDHTIYIYNFCRDGLRIGSIFLASGWLLDYDIQFGLGLELTNFGSGHVQVQYFLIFKTKMPVFGKRLTIYSRSQNSCSKKASDWVP